MARLLASRASGGGASRPNSAPDGGRTAASAPRRTQAGTATVGFHPCPIRLDCPENGLAEGVRGMIEPGQFRELRLGGGFVLAEVQVVGGLFVDALGRRAVARTKIVGRRFSVQMSAELSESELSISLYHEVLEAATIASLFPPRRVADFNEGDSERAARAVHERLGPVSPSSLNQMLRLFGVGGY